MESPKIAIVDDDPAVRDSLEILFEVNNHQTHSFPDGEVFVKNLHLHDWLVILLDVRMPGRDGLEIFAEIKKQRPGLSVVIMSGHADVAMAVRALKNGALDFFEKPFQAEEVLKIIDTLKTKRADQNRKFLEIEHAKTDLAKLTRRESQVATCLTKGMANKAIAHELGISVRTVETHRAHLMTKLNIKSLSDLIRLVLRAQE